MLCIFSCEGGIDESTKKEVIIWLRINACFTILGLKESKGYTYLDKTMAAGKPFAVIRIDKLYRIPKESFDAWMKQINQPIQN